MNSHLTSPRPNARVRRGSKRSNMGQIQVCNFNHYKNNEITCIEQNNQCNGSTCL